MTFIQRTIFGSVILASLGACLSEAAFASINFTFDTPVTLGTTQAPGVWYTDRYAPGGFVSPTFFDGDNRLLHSISDADGENDRPAGFSSTFYNTQGRKYDLGAGTTSMQIDLYIPSDWATANRRMAGFWGTAFDALNSVAAFPIIEFTSDGSNPRFRGWDSSGLGAWVDMGLPSGFAYDGWQTLIIELVGSNFVYTVGSLTQSVPALGSASLGNVILQGHNTADGVSYDIYWDNLSASAAPEPTALAVWCLLTVSSVLYGLRKQRNLE